MNDLTLVKESWVKLDSKVWGDYVEGSYATVDRIQFPPVKTKIDMVKRYSRGEFGNASPTWKNIEEFEQSNYRGLCHIRNRVASSKTWYNIESFQVRGYWHMIVDDWKQAEASQLYISAMAPKHLLNGELMRTHEGLHLFYSLVQKPMRDSLKEGGREAKGVAVQFILKHFMNQRSYDWTMMLLDRYPDHVIEFTVIDRCWGTVPGYNTLFWEVRQY